MENQNQNPPVMSLPLPKDEWKLKVNAQYQEAIKLLMNLVTACLVLPIVFVKDFIYLQPGDTFAHHLHNKAVYWSWFFLSASLLCGGVFYWASAKFVKVVCGGVDSMSEKRFEALRDRSIGGTVVCFVAGLISLLWFLYT